MRTWKIICLALGGLRRTPLRAGLTCLGVVIAAGALISMVAFALGIQARVEAPFEQLGLLKNIEVSPKGSRKDHEHGQDESVQEEDTQEDAPSKDAPILDDEVIGRIEALPGVDLAYPDFRLNDVEISYQDRTENSVAMGLPRDPDLGGFVRSMLVAGEPFGLKEVPEVILGEGLTGDLGFASPEEAVGAVVTLQASGLSPAAAASFTFERKQFEATVVGVYALPAMGPRFIRRGIILPVEMMKGIPGSRFSAVFDALRAGRPDAQAGYQRVVVRVEHADNLPTVEKQISQMGFDTHTVLSDIEEMRTFFVFMDVLLACVGTVALVVAALGIVNTLLMSVLERYQEIGIYKAIGASDGDLLVLFLTEASILGFLGGLGGLALGWIVSWGLEIAVNYYARTQGVQVHMQVFEFPFWLLACVIGFSVTIAVLAGVYPAVRAARIDPIRALRSE